ncbi:hypothetical protein MASR2M78_24660 [Treponema sp.]
MIEFWMTNGMAERRNHQGQTPCAVDWAVCQIFYHQACSGYPDCGYANRNCKAYPRISIPVSSGSGSNQEGKAQVGTQGE